MEETMKREQEVALATLMRANRAFERIFGTQWEEGDDGTGICDMCAGCPNCVREVCDECGEVHEEDFNE